VKLAVHFIFWLLFNKTSESIMGNGQLEDDSLEFQFGNGILL
jgi:hypothetical protein